MNKSSLNILLIIYSCFIMPAPETSTSMNAQAQVKPKESESKVAKSTAPKQTSIFHDVRGALLQKTRVPLRLPTFVPFDGDKESPIYAILKLAERESYDIELAWLPDCNGGNSCHLGSVRGSISPIQENDGTKTPVKLQYGIQGYFIDSTCGAHCDDSSVGWTEDGFHYSISLKAGKKSRLATMANSAIATSHPQSR